MPFHEKSAWTMAVTLTIGGILYFVAVASMSAELGHLAPPILPTVIVYTGIIIVLAIIGHIVIAGLSPREANAPSDERDKKVVDRAGHWSGYVLGVGAIAALGLYLFTYDGNLMFYIVFGSLMASQIAAYLCQIALYRRGVY
jgi:uncharacterized membrane protein (DUF485 family)